MSSCSSLCFCSQCSPSEIFLTIASHHALSPCLQIYINIYKVLVLYTYFEPEFFLSSYEWDINWDLIILIFILVYQLASKY